jgi:hypothetical protein
MRTTLDTVWCGVLVSDPLDLARSRVSESAMRGARDITQLFERQPREAREEILHTSRSQQAYTWSQFVRLAADFDE